MRPRGQLLVVAAVAVLAVAGGVSVWLGGAPTSTPALHSALRAPTISPSDHNNTSPPLRDLPPAPRYRPSQRAGRGAAPASGDRRRRFRPGRPGDAAGAADAGDRDDFDGIGMASLGPRAPSRSTRPAGHERCRRPNQLRPDREHGLRRLQQERQRPLRPGPDQYALERVRRGLPDQQRRRPDGEVRPDGGSLDHHPVLGQHARPISSASPSPRRATRPAPTTGTRSTTATRRSPTTRSSGSGLMPTT